MPIERPPGGRSRGAAIAALLVALAATTTIWTTIANVTVQLAAPDRLRGRFVSLFPFATTGLALLSSLIAGARCHLGGTQLALATAAAAVATPAARAALQLRDGGSRRRP
jgi:hypothetical protein